jgi:hypothetical protein
MLGAADGAAEDVEESALSLVQRVRREIPRLRRGYISRQLHGDIGLAQTK